MMQMGDVCMQDASALPSPSGLPGGNGARRITASPLAESPIALAALALASVALLGLLPMLLIRALGLDSDLWYVRAWWTGPNGGDSWLPIGHAREVLARDGPALFYQGAYYDTHRQFIYPPMSLVFFDLTTWPGVIEWGNQALMNRDSWWLTVACAAVTAAIMVKAPTRFGLVQRPIPLAAAIGLAFAGMAGTLLFFPLSSGFHNGNIQTWLNLLVLAAMLAWLLDARLGAGLLFGFVCIIKPQLSLLALWALFRRDWRLAAGMAAVVGLFGLASLARYGLKIHFDYVELMQHLTRRGESYVANHSVNGLLNRMLFLGPNVEFDPWHRSIPYDWRVHLGTVAASVALIVPAIWPWRADGAGGAARMSGMIDLSIGLLAFTLASPVAYVPHFGFMLPIFWITLLAILRTGWRPVMAFGLLAAAYVLASHGWFFLDALADTHWNFLQSTMFFAVLALLPVLFRLRSLALHTNPP
jgi:hypothetical protein